MAKKKKPGTLTIDGREFPIESVSFTFDGKNWIGGESWAGFIVESAEPRPGEERRLGVGSESDTRRFARRAQDCRWSIGAR